MLLKSHTVFLVVQALCTEGYGLVGLGKGEVLIGWATLHGFADLDSIKHSL
jgi:hypothetical protein